MGRSKLRSRFVDRVERLDRKLGLLWARACSTVFVIGGALALLSVVSLPDFTVSAYWPVLAMSALALAAAFACFRSRTGLMDQLSELPRDRPNKLH